MFSEIGLTDVERQALFNEVSLANGNTIVDSDLQGPVILDRMADRFGQLDIIPLLPPDLVAGTVLASNGDGGGINNASGTVTVINSTLSGNSASGAGGGIFNFNSGTVTVTNSTLSGNSASGGGGVFNSATVLPGQPNAVNKVTATTSLFANPAGGNLVSEAGTAFVSGGHNLFTDAPAVTLDPTDLTNTDPLLGPLADNGGPTFTQALLPGSPAIDAGVAVPGVTTDQRGIRRPQGSAPDIGAFEVVVVPEVVGLRRSGIHHQPTHLVLTFSELLDPSRAQDLSNYTLVAPGHDGRFGTRDDQVIRVNSATYDPNTRTVTLSPSRHLNWYRRYRITVKGTGAAGLTDLAGNLLDGNGDGRSGGDYVAIIRGYGLDRIGRPHPKGPVSVRHTGNRANGVRAVRGHLLPHTAGRR